MDAGLLDVLHDAAQVELGAVVEGVHVDLDGLVEELVDQHRVAALLGRHVGGERLLVVHDGHAGPAEHVGGADEHGVADLGGDLAGLADGHGGAVLGGGQARLGQHPPERAALLGQVDRLGRGADDGHARVLQRLRQAQRRLPAELHDHAGDRACLLLGVHDLQDVLQRERLEVEPVGGVVVGRDGLGVAVDHDGLEPGPRQLERGVHAGVVELDALPDAVGP